MPRPSACGTPWTPCTAPTGAVLEISAGAPTLWNSLNTFTTQNGTARDTDGFDAGSLIYQRLPWRSGTVTLDALKLGLATASQYNVRVLPVGRDGKAAGQASPSSTLAVDEGLPPANGQVVDFAAKGADSVAVVTDSADAGESVRHYNPATGAYGSVITSDTAQAGPYALLGVDDSAHRVVLMHVLNQDSYQLEVRKLSDGSLVGTPQVVQSSPGEVIGGRVDADAPPGVAAAVGRVRLPRRAAERRRRHRRGRAPRSSRTPRRR